jgi:hypothetical protein
MDGLAGRRVATLSSSKNCLVQMADFWELNWVNSLNRCDVFEHLKIVLKNEIGTFIHEVWLNLYAGNH